MVTRSESKRQKYPRRFVRVSSRLWMTLHQKAWGQTYTSPIVGDRVDWYWSFFISRKVMVAAGHWPLATNYGTQGTPEFIIPCFPCRYSSIPTLSFPLRVLTSTNHNFKTSSISIYSIQCITLNSDPRSGEVMPAMRQYIGFHMLQPCPGNPEPRTLVQNKGYTFVGNTRGGRRERDISIATYTRTQI